MMSKFLSYTVVSLTLSLVLDNNIISIYAANPAAESGTKFPDTTATNQVADQEKLEKARRSPSPVIADDKIVGTNDPRKDLPSGSFSRDWNGSAPTTPTGSIGSSQDTENGEKLKFNWRNENVSTGSTYLRKQHALFKDYFDGIRSKPRQGRVGGGIFMALYVKHFTRPLRNLLQRTIAPWLLIAMNGHVLLFNAFYVYLAVHLLPVFGCIGGAFMGMFGNTNSIFSDIQAQYPLSPSKSAFMQKAYILQGMYAVWYLATKFNNFGSSGKTPFPLTLFKEWKLNRLKFWNAMTNWFDDGKGVITYLHKDSWLTNNKTSNKSGI